MGSTLGGSPLTCPPHPPHEGNQSPLKGICKNRPKMLNNYEFYRTYRFEYMSRQEFSWRLRFFNQTQFIFYKNTSILIKHGGVNIFKNLEKNVWGCLEGLTREHKYSAKIKRCRKTFHRRISWRKQMKYLKTAPTNCLKFFFCKFSGGVFLPGYIHIHVYINIHITYIIFWGY